MQLAVYGINHRTAPVDIRENIAFNPDNLDPGLQALKQLPGIQEAAIISTCNRTEIYCVANDKQADIVHWLHQYHHQTENR